MQGTKDIKSGISLIVLVIEIVVMIILAATITLALGKDNIIQKADEVVKENNRNNIKEAAIIVVGDLMMNGYKSNEITSSQIKQKLIDDGMDEAIFDDDEIKYDDGKVEVIDKGEEEEIVLTTEEAQALYEWTGDTITRYIGPDVNTISIPCKIGQQQITKIECQYGGGINAKSGILYGGETTYANVKEVVISKGVTTISSYAFDECSTLTNIEIPSTVETIGDFAFYGCTGLKQIELPNSITTLGLSCFVDSGLVGLVIPDSVTTMGDGVLANCESLKSVRLSNNINKVPRVTFGVCTSLTDVTIPESITEIGAEAFNACSSLTTITIPKNVTNIGAYAFVDCIVLSSIVIKDRTISNIGNEITVGSGWNGPCTSYSQVGNDLVYTKP